MKLFAATIAVYLRGWLYTLLRRSDTTGLTYPCRGCRDPWPHDAHLAPGALTYLTRNSR